MKHYLNAYCPRFVYSPIFLELVRRFQNPMGLCFSLWPFGKPYRANIQEKNEKKKSERHEVYYLTEFNTALHANIISILKFCKLAKLQLNNHMKLISLE